jgi:hypothetical protein
MGQVTHARTGGHVGPNPNLKTHLVDIGDSSSIWRINMVVVQLAAPLIPVGVVRWNRGAQGASRLGRSHHVHVRRPRPPM